MKDVIGAVVSALCVLHCLSMPVLLTLASTSAMATNAHSPLVHVLFFVPVLVVAILSFPKARRQHGEKLPAKLALVGLTLLGLALIVEPLLHWHVAESVSTVIGGVILIYAHTLNRRLLTNMTSKSPICATGGPL